MICLLTSTLQLKRSWKRLVTEKCNSNNEIGSLQDSDLFRRLHRPQDIRTSLRQEEDDTVDH